MADLYNRNKPSYRDKYREQRQDELERLERDAKRSNKAAKMFMLLLIVASFVLSRVKKVHAANSSIIEKISINVEQVYNGQGEIDEPIITTSTSNVSVDGISYSKDPDNWKPGNRVLVTIDLTAASGYYFGSTWNRSVVTLKGAEFSHCGRVEDGDILRLKVYFIPCTILEDTSSAGWDYTFKKAVWMKVDYAPGYEVKLYENDKEVATKKVRTTTVDFSDKIEDYTKNKYYYEVKAIPMTSDEKKYLKEGNAVTSEEDVVTSRTGMPGVTPIGYNTTTDTGTSAIYNSNSTSTTGWYNPNGTWFYYDSYGRMATGWQYIGDKWYYFNSSGQMLTGFLKENDGNTYYLDPTSGQMRTGWVEINGFWYYFNSSGRMQTGYVYDRGKVYFIDIYGRMISEQ